MKTIEPISIWANGQVQQGTIFNCYAVNVTLNSSASFWYGIYTEPQQGQPTNIIAQGNLYMDGQSYTDWEIDQYAWDWAANQLNLKITGDYVPSVQ